MNKAIAFSKEKVGGRNSIRPSAIIPADVITIDDNLWIKRRLKMPNQLEKSDPTNNSTRFSREKTNIGIEILQKTLENMGEKPVTLH